MGLASSLGKPSRGGDDDACGGGADAPDNLGDHPNVKSGVSQW
jgi:hypothetical protein